MTTPRRTEEALLKQVEVAAASLSRWLAASGGEGEGEEDAAGGADPRRARARALFGPLEAEAQEEGCRLDVEPLDGPELDDATPMVTLFTLRCPAQAPAPSGAGLVIYGSHTALLSAGAGRPGCRHARLDPVAGEFRTLREARRIPPGGPVRPLGRRRFGAALYRVLLEGGAVVAAAEETRPHRIREEAATLLLESAGGCYSPVDGFGSTGVVALLARGRGRAGAPVSPPPPDPLFGRRGLFRP